MDTVTGISAYDQGETLLVEIVGRDADEELLVATYEFETVDEEDAVVRPRQWIEDTHRAPIRDALVDDGYRPAALSAGRH